MAKEKGAWGVPWNLQGDQLDKLAQRHFEARLTRLLLDTATGARGQLDTPAGQFALRGQIRRARGYGLTSELDIARYVVTAWCLGTDFDQRFPAMAQILGSSLTPAHKAEGIERVCITVLSALARDGS